MSSQYLIGRMSFPLNVNLALRKQSVADFFHQVCKTVTVIQSSHSLSPSVLLLSVLITFSSGAFAQDLLLFGGPNHDEYLGCLKCSDSRSDSVCNGFGKFGNEFSSNMWNEFSSPYGNEFSSSSPWNEFSGSKSVPVLVDKNGKFYGYFTINDTRSDAVRF